MLKVLVHAYQGALVADAVSMPVHWYYDTRKMDAVYGRITNYRAPLTPHVESFLERSQYRARNARGEILHNQSVFWGRPGVHYHQFLPAGGTTLNLQLSAELLFFVGIMREYKTQAWLRHYIMRMQTPGWHNDTYIEKWHRVFFENLSLGVPPLECGMHDDQIGRLSSVPALLCALVMIQPNVSDESVIEAVIEDLSATCRHRHVLAAAESLCRILMAIRGGCRIREAIEHHAQPWGTAAQFEIWASLDDRTVIGETVTRAGHLPDSYSAALYLAYKYATDFSAGILANAYCGGDSCHRGAIVGAILAADHGIDAHWIQGLQNRTVRRSLQLCEAHLQDDHQLYFDRFASVET